METVVNVLTGEKGKAIKWDGKNLIQVQQFGVTGTANGKATKLNCARELFVKENSTFHQCYIGEWIVQHGTVYKIHSEDSFLSNYKMEERENV